MIVCYHRSSSLGTLDFCEMQYFFQYVLGFKNYTNKKALMGTIVHRVLQLLADRKLAEERGEDKVINDDIKNLTLKECDDIDKITKLCFNYYKKHEPEVDLETKDLKTCTGWVRKALSYNDGMCDPRNQNIHATELFFDIEIKKPWAKFYYKVDGQPIKGYLSIKGTVDVIIKEDSAFFQVLDYKGLTLDTPILTTNGFVSMANIDIGDIVYDRFGKQTKVIAKSEVKSKECYKITFDDKSQVECDDEHFWTLSDNSIIQTPDLSIGMKINVAQPLDNQEVKLPIDPYVLGAWLGDGRNRSGEICCGDQEVFNRIENAGYSLGKDQEKRTTSCQSRTVYGLTTKLKQLNLINNKHIPAIYLKGSYEQRLSLLQGLMDSDGSVNILRKQCVFMNRNKRLSRDMQMLLRTLGQRPYLCTTKQKYKEKQIECYPVFFRPVNITPFCIDRKNKKISTEWGPGKSDVRRIINIEKSGIKQTQCIQVDSQDKTYLCTESLIPTHNTGRRLNWATGKEKTQACLQKDTQLLLYYYALKTMHPDWDFYVSIYYINDGGVFDVVFDESDYKKAENILKQKFNYIRSVEVPRQLSPSQSHWKCTKLCKFSQFDTEVGKTTCNHFHDLVKSDGITAVTAKYGDLDKLTKYGSGGGRLAEDEKKE